MTEAARRPLDRALYEDVVEEAKARFSVWPSAYASGWVVQEYKRRGGRYGGERSPAQGITKWFREQWVDLSRPIYDDAGALVGYEPCGRRNARQDDYPKCRPLAEALRMTPREVASAVRRKREVEKHIAPRRGRRPVNVATYANPAPPRAGLLVVCPCGWSWRTVPGDPEPLLCHECGSQAQVR